MEIGQARKLVVGEIVSMFACLFRIRLLDNRIEKSSSCERARVIERGTKEMGVERCPYRRQMSFAS
jgi:hypothetical protein